MATSKKATQKKTTLANKQTAGSKLVKIAVDSSPMKNRLPKKAKVAVSVGAAGLEIQLEKVQVELIRDQKQRMIQAIGCYNNPGGPTLLKPAS